MFICMIFISKVSKHFAMLGIRTHGDARLCGRARSLCAKHHRIWTKSLCTHNLGFRRKQVCKVGACSRISAPFQIPTSKYVQTSNKVVALLCSDGKKQEVFVSHDSGNPEKAMMLRNQAGREISLMKWTEIQTWSFCTESAWARKNWAGNLTESTIPVCNSHM